MSSLSLQKKKFSVERREDNDDTLKIKGEFVMNQAAKENEALRGTSVTRS